MSTPHNAAASGDIAKTVLMPGIRSAPNSLQKPIWKIRYSLTRSAICSDIPVPIRERKSLSWEAVWEWQVLESIPMSCINFMR